ncbi:hypothetical protein [Constantimarinum furrinae]|uniref:Uncharacterized protein n=1 Tax=Constantimarinum furrinae TaxID=2562285 RepID=A0A7G8PSJ2_9FLAO|nr:hypothetical protein [Constantimarinum furrinae]QNJ97308.1 hypothetical protein ALE3EI_0732 [Constantimarinum furrinae]
MKNFKFPVFAFLVILTFSSCSKNTEIYDDDILADSVVLGFCEDNYPINMVSGYPYRSRVELHYDTEYDGITPPLDINHEIEWSPSTNELIYSFTKGPFVQGQDNILITLQASEIGGATQGEWRVRMDAGSGSSNCNWSAWITY